MASPKSKNRKKSSSPLQTDQFINEIIAVVALAFALALFLSNFNIIGSFGSKVNGVFFGIFGITAYLIPFIIVFCVFVFMANRTKPIVKKKVICCVIFALLLSGLIQIFEFNRDYKLIDYFNISKDNKKYGGIVGGFITKMLCPYIGKAGAFIILTALLVILFVIITEKLVITRMIKNSLKAVDAAKAHHEKSGERRQEKRQERQERRQEKRNNTGSFDPNNTGRDKTNRIYSFSKEDMASDKLTNNVEPVKKNRKTKKSDSAGTTDITQISDTTDPYTGEVYLKELNDKFGNPIDHETQDESYRETEIFDDTDDKNWQQSVLNQAKIMPDYSSGRNASPADNLIPKDNFIQEDNFIPEDNGFVQETDTPQTEERGLGSKNKNSREKDKGSAKSDREYETIMQETSKELAKSVQETIKPQRSRYIFPPLNILSLPKGSGKGNNMSEAHSTAAKLKSTLESFGVNVTISDISVGPTVTRYELIPQQGIKVSKITNLTDDIKLSLAATDIRIEAPIPGKSAIGIEVPNKHNSPVLIRELFEDPAFKHAKASIRFAVGKSISGQPVIADISKMPHLLIAGQTGSGKSVCINTIIMSILYSAHPDDVKLIMIDPKVVELSVYNGVPHLLTPVVTDPKKAAGTLNWAVNEMVERYNKFAALGVRDIRGYNQRVTSVKNNDLPNFQKLSQIVIIVDELADLMMVAPGEVEDAICRLAQMARAAGMYLIIATQRPSVNVITGIIKANVPSRIAFSVASQIDSRTILDGAGAEKLLGKGDMLFNPSDLPKPVRVQGAFVSDTEVSDVVEFLKRESEAVYDEEIVKKIDSASVSVAGDTSKDDGGNDSARDSYYIQAGKYIIEKDKASIGMLQRVFKIGFNRAARIMDQLASDGVVGPEEGTKPRKILMTLEEFDKFIDEVV